MFKRANYERAYCLFCRTGGERQLRDEIEQRFDGIRVLSAVQEKHKVIDKRYEIDRKVFLPGYLFLYSNEEIPFERLLRIEEVYKILGDRAEAHELTGSDRAFANWLWQNDGVIEISKIRIKDGKLQILTGPMRYFAKAVIKLDKHTRNAHVRMDFLGKKSDIWLAFEFDDEKTEEQSNEE